MTSSKVFFVVFFMVLVSVNSLDRSIQILECLPTVDLLGVNLLSYRREMLPVFNSLYFDDPLGLFLLHGLILEDFFGLVNGRAGSHHKSRPLSVDLEAPLKALEPRINRFSSKPLPALGRGFLPRLGLYELSIRKGEPFRQTFETIRAEIVSGAIQAVTTIVEKDIRTRADL